MNHLRTFTGSLPILFSFGALFHCSTPDSNAEADSVTQPVVGGVPAQPSDYPSTVAVTNVSGDPFCSGTLIAPSVVVTAAHCVEKRSPSSMRVVYGHTVPEQAPASERRIVTQAVAHPHYNTNAPVDAYGLGPMHDIGVLILQDPIENGIVAPVLPNAQVDAVLYPNRTLHIAGYGIYNTASQASGVLYKGLTPHIRHVPTELLGGRSGEPDACFGDSGGPAYVVDQNTLWLVGATSRAWEHAVTPCGHATVYTLVSPYVDWIETVAGPLSGGNTDGGFNGGGWDGGTEPDAPLLDGNPSCVPLNSVCHPITNEGCDTAAGEACRFDALMGTLGCFPGPNTVPPGKICDQTSRFCQYGYFCGASIRCEKICCSDDDCPDGVPCTPIISLIGNIGTCGPVTIPADAAVPDEASADASDDVEDAQKADVQQPEEGGTLDGFADTSSESVPTIPEASSDGELDTSEQKTDADFIPPDAIQPGCACAQQPSGALRSTGLLWLGACVFGWIRRRRRS